MEGIDAVVWETDDPEVVVTEITHHGHSRATGEPYRLTALGVSRVRDGEIIRYDDYMDPIAVARLLGRPRRPGLRPGQQLTATTVTGITGSQSE